MPRKVRRRRVDLGTPYKSSMMNPLPPSLSVPEASLPRKPVCHQERRRILTFRRSSLKTVRLALARHPTTVHQIRSGQGGLLKEVSNPSLLHQGRILPHLPVLSMSALRLRKVHPFPLLVNLRQPS